MKIITSVEHKLRIIEFKLKEEKRIYKCIYDIKF